MGFAALNPSYEFSRLTISNSHTRTPFRCAARCRASLRSFCPPRRRGGRSAVRRVFQSRACEAREATLTRRGAHRISVRVRSPHGAPTWRSASARFRLASVRASYLSPATATGQNLARCAHPVVPPGVGHRPPRGGRAAYLGRHPRSAFRIASRSAPSMSEDDAASTSVSFRSQFNYFVLCPIL